MNAFRNIIHSREALLYTAILFLVEFVRGAFVISFLPIYGEKALSISYGVIGLAMAALYMSDTAVKLAIGYLMNRFTIRQIISCGLVVSLTGILIIPYASVPWILLISSALYGVGISPIWIICLARVTQNERGTQMGFLYTVWLVGLGSGPVVANVLLDLNRSIAYWMLVVLIAIPIGLSFLIQRTAMATLSTIPFRKQLTMLAVRLRRMKPLIPGMILQTTGAGMLIPILPAFAETNLGITSSRYSLLLLAGGGCTAIGLIPLGRLSDRWGRKWFLVIGFSMFAFALYSLTIHPSFAVSLLWAFVLGISYAAVLPAWNALLAQYVPRTNKGLGWGVLSTFEGIGVMIGPVIGGYLASLYSEALTVKISAALFAAIAIFYILFPNRLFGGVRP